MVAVVIGSVGAAFIAAWLGHQLSGGPAFDHVLATSKINALLHAPISLGAHGALAFWPLAAAAVAGGIELVGVLKVRRQEPYGGLPMPGIESFDSRPFPNQHYLGRPSSGQPGPGQPGAGQPGFGQPGFGQDSAAFGQDAYGSGGQEQQDSGPGHGGR